MAQEPEDFTSESIRRKALSAAIDDLNRTYEALKQRPGVVISIGAFGRLERMREVLKAWPNPPAEDKVQKALIDQVKLFRKTVEYYIRLDVAEGDTEGANMKRSTLVLIDQTLKLAGAA